MIKSQDDPLFAHARRELFLTLMVWAVFGLWVVGYSWMNGQHADLDPESMKTILGMPGWVFWGVALPWVLANGFTFWFCFGFMTDNELRVVKEEMKPSSHQEDSDA